MYSMSSKSAYSQMDSPVEMGVYMSGMSMGGLDEVLGSSEYQDYRLEPPRPDESSLSLKDERDYSRRVFRVTSFVSSSFLFSPLVLFCGLLY